MRRVFLISLLALLALLAVGAGTAWYLLHDEDFVKARLAAFVLDFSGRELQIDGTLRLELGRRTSLEANGIRLANADWAEAPDMARVGHLRIAVDVPSLFGDTPILPELQVDDCRIELAKNRSGETNWDALTGPDEPEPPDTGTGSGLPVLLLDNRVRDCTIVFDSPQRPKPLRLELASLDLQLIDRLRWRAETAGRINQQPLSLSGWMEPQGAMLHGDPSEHELDLQVGEVRLHSAGRFENSKTGTGADVDLRFTGPDMAAFLTHIGMPPFSEGPFDFRLSLDTEGPMVQLRTEGDLGLMTARAEGELDRLAQPTRGSLKAGVSGPRLDLLGQALGLEGLIAASYDADATMSFEPGRVLFDSVTLTTDGDTLTISGGLGTGDELANSDLQVDLKVAELGRWAGLWGQPPQETGRADLVGRLTSDASGLFAYRGSAAIGADTLVLGGPLGFVSGPLQADVELDLNLGHPSATARLLEIKGLPAAPLSARGRLRADPQRVRFEEIQLDLGEHRGTLDGEIATTRPFTGSRLSVQLESPNAADLGRLFGREGLPAAPLRVQGNVGRPDQRLRLEGVELALAEHRLKLDGYLEPGDPRWTIHELQAHLSSPDASKLAQVLDIAELPAEPIDMNVDLRRDGQGARFKLEQAETPALRFQAEGAIPDLGQPLFMNADFDVQLQHLELLSFLKPDIPWPDLPLSARGRVRIEEDRAVLQGVRGELGSMSADLSGHIGEDRSFALELDARGPDASELQDWVNFPLQAKPFSLQTELRGSENRLEFPRLKAELGPSRADAQLTVDLEEVKRLSGNVRSEYLDLTHWVVESPETESEDSAEQQAFAFVFDDTPVDRLEDFGWAFDVTASLQKVVLANGHFSDVEVGAKISAQRVDIDPFAFKGTYGGQSRGHLLVDFSGGVPQLDLELHGEDIRSGILSLPDQDPSTSPASDIDIDLRGRGNTRREMASSLDGRVRLNSGPGQVASSGVEFLFTDFVTELLELLNPFSEKSPATNLECMVVAADVRAGQVEVYPVVVNTEELTIFSKGNINLATERMDLSFNTKPRKGLGITTGVLINPLIKVGGTLAKPAIEFDPANAIVSGGAAVATAGLTVVLKGFADRFLSSKDPCGDARKEIDKRDAS